MTDRSGSSALGRGLIAAGGLAGAAAAAGTYGFWRRYGGRGRPFPDLSTEPLLPPGAVEVVAELPWPPGNLTVSAAGRIFCTHHPESRPEVKVFELVGGAPVPWPDEAWQGPRGTGEPFFDQTFNLRCDGQGRLWSCDPGLHGLRQPRLLAFDLDGGELVHRADLPRDAAGPGSYVQDMQIDSEGRFVYVADTSALAKRPAILVHDARTGATRRVLERHPSVVEEPYEINSKGRRMYRLGGLFWMHPALDPIGLDKRDEWLYFGPMSGGTLYRARTADLTDATLGPEELGARVEAYARKSQCDGISLDLDGNVYVTSVEDGAINVIGADRRQRTLVRHPLMRWPDGLSFGPGGWLYVADSDFPDLMMRSKRSVRAHAPYHVFRVRTGHEGVPGH